MLERHGKVVVVRLKKKKPVEQKPCVRRLLYRLKAFFSPTAEEISADEVVDLLIKTFGNYRYYLLLADERYTVYPIEVMLELIKKDDTKQLQWYSERFDCDNFSLRSAAKLHDLVYPSGICYGELWFYSKSGDYGHAINVFIARDGNELKVYCAEPQNGQLVAIDKDDWQVLMIKIC